MMRRRDDETTRRQDEDVMRRHGDETATRRRDAETTHLRHDTLGTFHQNTAELSEKLEQVIVDWLPDVDHVRRKQLCGGTAEKGNGSLEATPCRQ